MTTASQEINLFLEDYKVGDQFETIRYTLQAQEIIDFALLWDPQDFHTDEESANDSDFGGLTACSSHIFSIFTRICQHWTNGVKQQAIASLGFDVM